MPVDTSALLSAEQVAARLNLSRTAIYALCDSGELQHHRIGVGKKKRIRVSELQLAKYLEETTASAPAIAAPVQKPKQPVTYAGASRLRALGWKG